MATKSTTAVVKRDSSTGKYVVSVPSSVRTASGMKEGDAVVFTVTPDGRAIMRPKTGLASRSSRRDVEQDSRDRQSHSRLADGRGQNESRASEEAVRLFDTYLLVRILTRDDVGQVAVIDRLLDASEASGEQFFVPLAVILELERVLRSVHRRTSCLR
jgi:bifunctional DNA-binding transcriptional regulator/antitoxin component of YhaV-PrlF toxin-antitoxin module